jgi:hypothetical protein
LRRKDFSGPLTPIRILRNRIAHREPILAWNLARHHAAMRRLIQWLSPGAAARASIWTASPPSTGRRGSNCSVTD